MSHIRVTPVPESPPGRVIPGSLLSAQSQTAGRLPLRVQPGPRIRVAEPVVRVERSDPSRTLLAVTCPCGEVIEIELLHPPGGDHAGNS
jgi:hypothetical protein